MIQVFGSNVGQEELDEIKTSFDEQWLGAGPKVAKFEKEFSERCGFKNFVMTDSASNSLYLAIKILNLKSGTEIILPSFTFVSCAQAVIENNCVPVFCDVDLNTQNPTIETILPSITKNTGAILVVHYAGLPVNMKPIVELGIPIIEDCAHAVDSYVDGVHCGALGDIGVFSFDSMKNLSIGEGGGITAASPTFIEKVRRLRYCGIAKSGIDASKEQDRWWETEVLYNSLRHMPNDVSASIAIAQLKKLDRFQETRKHIWELYKKGLRNLPFKLPEDPEPNERHSYFTFFVRMVWDSYTVSHSRDHSRDSLAKYLLANGIYTTLRYYPINRMKLFKQDTCLPNTDVLNKYGLNLPLHPRLTDQDLDYIINRLNTFFGRI